MTEQDNAVAMDKTASRDPDQWTPMLRWADRLEPSIGE